MTDPLATPQVATARIRSARPGISVTPGRLLAIGVRVAAVLLAVPPIIRAAADARQAGNG